MNKATIFAIMATSLANHALLLQAQSTTHPPLATKSTPSVKEIQPQTLAAQKSRGTKKPTVAELEAAWIGFQAALKNKDVQKLQWYWSSHQYSLARNRYTLRKLDFPKDFFARRSIPDDTLKFYTARSVRHLGDTATETLTYLPDQGNRGGVLRILSFFRENGRWKLNKDNGPSNIGPDTARKLAQGEIIPQLEEITKPTGNVLPPVKPVTKPDYVGVLGVISRGVITTVSVNGGIPFVLENDTTSSEIVGLRKGKNRIVITIQPLYSKDGNAIKHGSNRVTMIGRASGRDLWSPTNANEVFYIETPQLNGTTTREFEVNAQRVLDKYRFE
jgi:hypothetical protein